jgi:hypothetical protein
VDANKLCFRAFLACNMMSVLGEKPPIPRQNRLENRH